MGVGVMNYKRLRVYWRKAKWPLALLCALCLLLWWYVEVIRDWNRFSIRQVYPGEPPDYPERDPEHGFQSLYFLVEGVGDPYVRLKYVQTFVLSYHDSWAPLLMEKRRDGLRSMIHFMTDDVSLKINREIFYYYSEYRYICAYKAVQYRTRRLPCIDEVRKTVEQLNEERGHLLWPMTND